MTASNTIFLTSIGAAAFTIFGCDVYMERHERPVYVHQPPQQRYVEAQPQYVEAQPQYVIVQEAPPAIIVERRPAAPSVAHIWIDGSWNWDSKRYVWQAGRYEVPPQAGAVWISARYEPNTHRYVAGQWQKHDNGHDNGHNNAHDKGHDNGRGNN